MNVRLSAIDEEIQQLEERIARDRTAFVTALGECGHSVRETVSSPKALLAAAGVGFVAGKILFRSGGDRKKVEKTQAQQSPSKLGGMLGLIVSGLSLMQPASGAGGLARWAAQQLWERRQRRGAAGTRRREAPARATTPRGKPDQAMPPVRVPPRGAPAQTPVTSTGVRY